MTNEPATCAECHTETRDYYRRSPATGRPIKAAICRECYERLALIHGKTRFDEDD